MCASGSIKKGASSETANLLEVQGEWARSACPREKVARREHRAKAVQEIGDSAQDSDTDIVTLVFLWQEATRSRMGNG